MVVSDLWLIVCGLLYEAVARSVMLVMIKMLEDDGQIFRAQVKLFCLSPGLNTLGLTCLLDFFNSFLVESVLKCHCFTDYSLLAHQLVVVLYVCVKR